VIITVCFWEQLTLNAFYLLNNHVGRQMMEIHVMLFPSIGARGASIFGQDLVLIMQESSTV